MKEETERQVRAVIALMRGGRSTQKACAALDFPVETYYHVLQREPALMVDHRSAQHCRAELLADEIVDIADTEIDAQTARNRINARQWYAARILPAQYGDRIDVNVTERVDVRSAMIEARKRIALPVCDQARIEHAQTIDTTYVEVSGHTDSESVTTIADLLK